jgi:hypothetical protein
VLTLQLGRFWYDYSKNIPIKVCLHSIISFESVSLSSVTLFLLPFKIQKNVEYPPVLTLPTSILSDDLRRKVSRSVASSGPSAAGAAEAGAARTPRAHAHSRGGSGGSSGGISGGGSSGGSFGSNDGGPVYELQAVVLHHGKKASAGHYSCYVKDHNSLYPSTLWKGINDSKISLITESQALSAQDSVSSLFLSV